MRQILLSPEFQLFSPFFIIFLLILLVSIAFLILKIIAVCNEVKSRKLLEKLFNETDGGDAMKPLDGKTILEQALQGLTPTGASGNQTAMVRFLASAAQGFTNQATGAIQKMQQLTIVKATSDAMRTGEQIIESLDSHIQAAQGQFDGEAPRYEASALGNTAPEQNSLGTLAEAGVDVVISNETQPEIPAGISALTEVEVVELLQKMGCVRNLLEINGINPDSFVFQDLSTPLLDKLTHIFAEKIKRVVGTQQVCTKEEKRIHSFLLQLQAGGNG